MASENKFILLAALIWLATALALFANFAIADDPRFCGVVYRYLDNGAVVRSSAVVREYKRLWPCVHPCNASWQIDHPLPLADGGCDSVINMQWMPPNIKTCAATINILVDGAMQRAPNPVQCKDRWERKLYGGRPVTTIFVER